MKARSNLVALMYLLMRCKGVFLVGAFGAMVIDLEGASRRITNQETWREPCSVTKEVCRSQEDSWREPCYTTTKVCRADGETWREACDQVEQICVKCPKKISKRCKSRCRPAKCTIVDDCDDRYFRYDCGFSSRNRCGSGRCAYGSIRSDCGYSPYYQNWGPWDYRPRPWFGSSWGVGWGYRQPGLGVGFGAGYSGGSWW